jgi:YVTN family beta-propeller protein
VTLFFDFRNLAGHPARWAIFRRPGAYNPAPMTITKRTLRHSGIVAALLTSIACLGAAAASAAPYAYTANYETGSVSVISTETNRVVGEIKVGEEPASVAVTPDGTRAFVVNYRSGSVSVIDTATRKTIGPPIKLDEEPSVIAISPDGKTAYVSEENESKVVVIDTRTDAVIGSISGIENPYGLAISPDGESLYVASTAGNSVDVVSTRTLALVGKPIPVGEDPEIVLVAPDGKTVYVTDEDSDEVSAITTATREVRPIAVGPEPWGLGMTPDGRKLFVSNSGGESVSVVDPATDLVSDVIPVGDEPFEFGMAPNGKVAYLAEYRSEDVIAIDTQTDKVIGEPIKITGGGPWQVVVAPDQSPTAAFSAPSATATVPALFSGAASTDPDGTVASWSWAFGDGGSATGVGPSHTYSTAGNYSATLSVVDNEGCGPEVFTGRTALCSGGTASVAHPVSVAAAPKPIVVPPSNKFHFGRLVHNRKNGTARLQVKLASAGSVVLVGPKVHMVRKKIAAAGSLWLTIHARVKLNKMLKQTLRAKVGFRITFTPTGGTAKTTARSIVLQRAPRKKHR